MINLTSEQKKQINSDKISYKEYVILTENGIEVGDKIEVNAETYQSAYKDTTFFGTFNVSYIKFNAENNVIYKGKELNYYKQINDFSFKIGHYIVTEIKDSDTFEEVQVTAYDNGLKFSSPYTTNLNYSTNKVTLQDVLNEICQNVGVQCDNTYITNGSFIVDSNQFVNGELYGDVISAIAIISGNFATINDKGHLEFIFNKPTDEIIEDYVELDDKRDTLPITCLRIGWENIVGAAVRKDTKLIEEYGENWLTINDCPFAYTTIKQEQLIDAIFNKVKGFGYSSFEAKYSFKPYYQLGDKIQFKNKNGDLINSVLLRIETKYDEITLSAPSIIKSTVEYESESSTEKQIKKAFFKIDQENKKIQGIISDIGDRSQKTTTLTQDIDRIEGEISEVADVTTTADGYGTINLDNINGDSEPIYLRIYPTSEDIIPLRPRIGLQPKVGLFPHSREIFIKNISSDESYQLIYNIPCNLYQLNGIFDEFILNYETQQCYVIHRIEINENGEKYLLEIENIENFDYPSLPLTEGDYQIYTPAFNTAYIYARLMAKNIYTSQFATKVELNSKVEQTASSITTSINQTLTNYDTKTEVNSKISQTADEINSEVSKKVGNNEIISKINQSAEAVGINANKIELSANDILNLLAGNTINLTSKNIVISSNNFTVDKNGNLNCNNASMKNVSIEGGKIQLNSSGGINKVIEVNSSFGKVIIQNTGILLEKTNGDRLFLQGQGQVGIWLDGEGADGSGSTQILTDMIMTPQLIQTSKVENKKNFEKLQNALDIIKSTDIYKYNLKNEQDGTKKHIGFVIGNDYEYSEELTSKDNNGVDSYTVASCCVKAIQEQQELIEQLQKEIKELKEGK